MSLNRKVSVAAILSISSSFFCTKSQDSIHVIQIIEAVGAQPSALVYASDSLESDSLKSAALSDTLSADYLTDLFSIFQDGSLDHTDGGYEDDSLQTFSVLEFMTTAYGANGFYDSGNLNQPKRKRRLDIYEGPLPKIDESKLCRPVKGKITSPFGGRPDSDNIHYGIDLAGKTGDTVLVALPGIVTKCGFDKKGYGRYVCVTDSSGLETRYAHLSKVLVKRGDELKYKAPVGLVGATGNSTGPHLHFEIRYKGKVINPIMYLLK